LRGYDYVRPPAVAGLFYPAERTDLERIVKEFLADAKRDCRTTIKGAPFGLIAPHAGYQYSGYTAAYGYSLLDWKQFETVVIISPSHREYFDGVSVFSGRAYSTPLGEVEIDDYLRDAFLKKAGEVAVESNAGHRSEHAIEVQLPFLQVAMGEFKLLPIVMGNQRPSYCKVVGSAVADIANERSVLVVASSDLSHYYDYDTANEIDKRCMDAVLEMVPENFLGKLESRQCEACGGGPIAALMFAARLLQRDKVSILYHCNSGDSSGDKSSVVGYLSAVFCG
jgi:AmmeMemoRadiSam system protein B